MSGPPPKDPAIRQRRNKASTAAALAPQPPAGPPELPARDPTAKPWHAMTQAWWKDIWSSPMAKKFLTSDRHGLFILAELVDRFWHEPSPEMAREIRLQGARYGESPLDRWRLQWAIKETAEEKARPQTPPRAAPADDPRKVLAMVKR